MNKITVIGSINLDTNIRITHLPKPGETIQSEEIFSSSGGKGANQAVTAARNGAQVNFIGAVGDDSIGKSLIKLLKEENINTNGIKQLKFVKTGSAYVNVSDEGENNIIIHGGANQLITNNHILKCNKMFKQADFVLAQFETNLSSIRKGFELAKKAESITILNPAPAKEKISKDLINLTDILIPNETELEIIVGNEITNDNEFYSAIQRIHEMGIKIVIVTLGSKGVFYSIIDSKQGFVPAYNVDAIDTTAAGDTFIGSFVTKLSKDLNNIKESILYGNKAASLTVQRYGAQSAIPYKEEVDLELIEDESHEQY